MTCIAGIVEKNDVWLAGDRAATGGGLSRILIKHPKIFIKSGIGIGVCGLPKVIDAVQQAIDLPTKPKNMATKEFLIKVLVPVLREGLKKYECTEDHNGSQVFHGAMLIACSGELHELESNFQLIETSNGFNAVGSGGEAALGSLRASKGTGNAHYRLKKALEVSAENNAGVAPPFDFLKISGELNVDNCFTTA